MTAVPAQAAASLLPAPLTERLEALGVCVLEAHRDGSARPMDMDTPAVMRRAWLGRLITEAPVFRVTLRQKWDELIGRAGERVECWPGLWLIALPPRRRRGLSASVEDGGVPVVMLFGHELTGADQLRAVCDSHRLDHRAVVARIEPDQLMTAEEAQRLASMLGWMHQDAMQLGRRVREIQTLSTELAESYEELSLLYKLSNNMVVNQPPEQFLTDACGELQQVVGLGWTALLLIDEQRLESLRGKLFCAGPVKHDTKTLERIGNQLLERLDDPPEPKVEDDTAALGIPGLEHLAGDLLVIPLRSEKQTLGILFGADKLNGEKLSSVDSKLCDSLASSLAIFLENRMLYDDMQAMFMGTLRALTAAIDAKDSYTHGHSERVAIMSRRLAEGCGLDEETCERIYIAGLVHDVGKIGVPEAVLSKPGKLTDEEFALIKMHPEIGGRILQGIRQMQDLLPGVLHHHERWDGRGYPHQLAGEEIPLFGRVIGLADAFDAMSSDRTYRKAMNPETVLEEVHRCAGTQFDPQLAEVFVRLDFTPFFELIERHEQGASP